MRKSIKILFVAVFVLTMLGGCASQTYHDYIMSGQVVTIADKQAVVCVSDTDELKEHQVFNVYRTVYDTTAIAEGESAYSRIFIGKIRLGKSKDQHFAEATVLDGEIARYDIVEFSSGF
jgi:mannose/fructose/N-acetylgalactosamine-specific phosphotransferase system component IIB